MINLDQFAAQLEASNLPSPEFVPYRTKDRSHVVIDLNVPGFNLSDFNIYATSEYLYVKAEKSTSEFHTFAHPFLAKIMRSEENPLPLSQETLRTTYEGGTLRIEIKVPDSMKPVDLSPKSE